MAADRRRVGAAIAVALVWVAVLGATACSRSGAAAEATVLTIGTMANAGDTLFYVAEDQGYLLRNGLAVSASTYPNGLAAVDALLAGEVDVAYATEFVVAQKALQHEDLAIIAVYSQNETARLMVRTDRGIDEVADLEGKRIGLARGAITEFYLGRLLELNGMSVEDVVLVDLALAELGEALSAGQVDAVIAGSRHAHAILTAQGEDVFAWSAHSGQAAYGTLVARKDWIAQHPELIERLLRSLAQGEGYVVRHADEARATMQQRLDYDDAYAASVWSEYQIALSLDQALIIAMEDEARWMVRSGLVAEQSIPEFREYLYPDGLEAAKPGSVRIIR